MGKLTSVKSMCLYEALPRQIYLLQKSDFPPSNPQKWFEKKRFPSLKPLKYECAAATFK